MLQSTLRQAGPPSGPGKAGKGKVFVAGLGSAHVGDQWSGNFPVAGCDGERETRSREGNFP